MDELATRIKVGIEEIILIALIIISMVAVLAFLPGDIHFAKKIISWIALGYLFYKIDLAELFFGQKNKVLDGLLIFSYFCLILKDFFTFSKELTHEAFLLFDFNLLFEKSIALGGKVYLLQHPLAETIQFYAFLLGAGIIVCIALSQLVLPRLVQRPSILGLFHEGMPTSFLDRAYRTLTSFFVILAFFIIIFNLVMEWLAWVIHSWIILFAVFFYFFFFIKYHQQFHVSTMIYKIGNAGHGFYHKFLDLFMDKKTVFLGLSGMLVFHLLTDIGTFILPYIIGKKASYFASLGPSHDPLIVPLLQDFVSISGSLGKAGVVLLYLLNIVAILFLFLGPAFIWRFVYKAEQTAFPKWSLALFYPSVIAFLFAPVFRITQLKIGAYDAPIVGADIQTHSLPLSGMGWVLLAVVIVALIVGFLVFIPQATRFLSSLAIAGISFFLGWYIFHYVAGVMGSYLSLLASPGLPLVFFVFFAIFFGITILFYVASFFGFVILPWKKPLVEGEQMQ